MMQLAERAELGVTFAAMALLVVSGARAFVSFRKSRTFWAAMAAAASIFALRWMVAEPTFVHASLHGPRLLEYPYNNPYETFRGYGPLAPLLHGWTLRYVGPNLTYVALLHQLCMSFSLVPLAWMASRLTRSRLAMIGVFLVAALHPVLVRIGASEDGHALAVLMAWIGLAGMYSYAETGLRSRLLLGTAALVLMMHTRQIMLVVLPFAFLLALAQRPRAVRDRWFVAAIAICGALVGLRLSALGSNSDQTFHIRSIIVRFSSLSIVIATFRHHPLFDVGLYQPFFVPLWSIGAVAAWRSSRSGRVFVVFFAAMFVSTLWLYEGRNVALMFRMPLLTVACALAGIGIHRLFLFAERRLGRHRSTWIAAVAGSVILCVPRALPGWRIVDTLSPLLREYRCIAATAPRLPKRVVLVAFGGGGIDRPGYQFATHLLRGAGIEVAERTAPAVIELGHGGDSLIFFRGVSCYAYSLIELSNLPTLDFASIIRVIGEPAASHRVPASVVIPTEMRPECAAILRGAQPIGDLIRVPAQPFDVPFILYGVPELEMGFYQVTPEAVRAAAAVAPR